VRAYHPRITNENHTVTSPKSPEYNCISHGLEVTDTLFAPGGFPGTQWPSGIDQSDSVAAFRQFFEIEGFVTCESADVEPGFVKVAIYADGDEATHVARQLADGRWTSKLGNLQDIEHGLSTREDDRYGVVVLLMRRPLPGGARRVG